MNLTGGSVLVAEEGPVSCNEGATIRNGYDVKRISCTCREITHRLTGEVIRLIRDKKESKRVRDTRERAPVSTMRSRLLHALSIMAL